MVLLGCFILFSTFALLGARGLNEPDEGRYAEMSREMLASNDWLVPTLHGFAHYQKPPLIYWLTAASLNLFGMTEWAARLPSALAAALTAWLTFVTGRRLFGERGGVAAGVVLVTSLQFFVLARMLTPDMVLTAWTTGAIASLVLWARDQEKRYWLWLFFVVMGMGFLTKGPMALVVPISAAVGWQLGHKLRGQPMRIPWLRGLVITLTVGVSWFLVVAIRDPSLFHYFAVDELVRRVATKQHGRYQPPWFFIPVTLIGFMPWTLVLPNVVRWLKGDDKPGSVAWWMIGAWLLVPFLILSFSGSKLITYVLPLYPALALAVGGWWAHHAHRAKFNRLNAWVVGVFLSVFLVVSFTSAYLPEIHTPWPSLLGLFLAVLTMALPLVGPRVQPATAAGALAVGALGFWLLLGSCATPWNPLLRANASMRRFGDRINQDWSSAPTVFAFEANVPGLEFYLGRPVYVSTGQVDASQPPTSEQKRRVLTCAADCVELAPPGQTLMGVIKSNRLGRDFSTNLWQLVDSSGSFALVRRKEPWTSAVP